MLDLLLLLLLLFFFSVSEIYFVGTALEILVEKRITGFPVIDDEWKLVRKFSTSAILIILTL